MTDCDCSVEVESREQSRVLLLLLAINATMFAVEFVMGIIAESTGLIADSLDMLADMTVYAIGFYAVGKAAIVKINPASMSGYFQILLAMGVAIEIVRRLIWGSNPEALFMIGISILALIANIVCLALISRHREGEVHMRASWIFSKNDIIANSGVILAGVLVLVLDSRLPDLVIGVLIVLVILKGGYLIITDANNEREKNKACID